MDRHPRACWFAAIPGAQKAKDVEDCLKNTAARSLNTISSVQSMFKSVLSVISHVLQLSSAQLSASSRLVGFPIPKFANIPALERKVILFREI